jgi:hypothetical protein
MLRMMEAPGPITPAVAVTNRHARTDQPNRDAQVNDLHA